MFHIGIQQKTSTDRVSLETSATVDMHKVSWWEKLGTSGWYESSQQAVKLSNEPLKYCYICVGTTLLDCISGLYAVFV